MKVKLKMTILSGNRPYYGAIHLISAKNSRCRFYNWLIRYLSVSLHVQPVITSCAQTLYALRVLRAHGLCESALHTVYRAVIVAKLMYEYQAPGGVLPVSQTVKNLRRLSDVVFALVSVLQIWIMTLNNYAVNPIMGCST